MEEPTLTSRVQALLAAYENLFLAARTTLEMAEPVDEMESAIHPEVLEELEAAYLAVYEQQKATLATGEKS